MTPTEIQNALKRPFHPSKVSWRVGATDAKRNQGRATKGIALAYIDARDVMKRLDTVMGFDWQNKYSLADSGLLVCDVGIKIEGEWIWRSNGAGDTQVEAVKGKSSDAFKRAAVMWGIGRYLYSLPNTWVDLDDRGKIRQVPKLPVWATPEGYDSLIEKQEKS